VEASAAFTQGLAESGLAESSRPIWLFEFTEASGAFGGRGAITRLWLLAGAELSPAAPGVAGGASAKDAADIWSTVN
jgi:hypothetical protein